MSYVSNDIQQMAKALVLTAPTYGLLLFIYYIIMLRQGNQIFQYNGSPITFLKGDSVMVNATQMAKPFGKRATHWLSNQQSKDFINALSGVRNLTPSDLVKVTNGDGGCTWMHEDVALEFARWLSPSFAIWCNDRIKELLTTGVSTISNDDETILHAIQVLQRRVAEKQQAIEYANKQIELQSEQLKAQAPKVEYTDNVLNSVNTYTSTQMAKELDLRTAEQLHGLLKGWGVMIHQSGQWLLAAKYCGQNYTKTRTHSYTRQDGTQGTNHITVWTETGRWFLHQLMEQKGGAQ